MNIDEAIANYDQFLAALPEVFKREAEAGAQDAVALIQNRIQQEGIPGRSYSENPLPVFWFEGKALNAGGRALLDAHTKKKERAEIREAGGRVRANKKLDNLGDGISYKEWRDANGLQTGHIDLTFTGKMWRGVKRLRTDEQGRLIYTVSWGGFDKETEDKLQWNAERFGDFFNITPEEASRLSVAASQRIEQLLTQLIQL